MYPTTFKSLWLFVSVFLALNFFNVENSFGQVPPPPPPGVGGSGLGDYGLGGGDLYSGINDNPLEAFFFGLRWVACNGDTSCQTDLINELSLVEQQSLVNLFFDGNSDSFCSRYPTSNLCIAAAPIQINLILFFSFLVLFIFHSFQCIEKHKLNAAFHFLLRVCIKNAEIILKRVR